MRFIDDDENVTYRVSAGGHYFLLRLHRPGKHQPGYVESELAWLEALRQETDLSVPEPVPSAAGLPVAVLDGVECSLLRWQAGRRMSRGARPVHLRRLGAAMAGLHAHARRWVPPPGFARPRWDRAGCFDIPGWDLVPAAHRRRWRAAADRAGELMDGSVDDLLLIHADLHLDNVVFHHGEARLIDFDDCGFGYPIYDVAVALWELRWRDDWRAWRDAFEAGYGSPIEPGQLDAFIAAREVIFGLWYAGRAQEHPGMAVKLAEELDYIAGSLDRLIA